MLCPFWGSRYTYNWKIAEHFGADLVPIAWSGKGMYKNCCDDGELMPAYWLQTLGGSTDSTDWDHSRYVPDMMIINLGTNDFGHDAGPVWEKAFSDTYTEFVLNATRIYKNPKLPVFVAQGTATLTSFLDHFSRISQLQYHPTRAVRYALLRAHCRSGADGGLESDGVT